MGMNQKNRGNYKYQEFTGSGTLSVGVRLVNAIIVGAGGGGGGSNSNKGGGGGGAEIIVLKDYLVTGDKTVTIGSGGAGGTGAGNGSAGGDTTLGDYIAGGGGGGLANEAGGAGGATFTENQHEASADGDEGEDIGDDHHQFGIATFIPGASGGCGYTSDPGAGGNGLMASGGAASTNSGGGGGGYFGDGGDGKNNANGDAGSNYGAGGGGSSSGIGDIGGAGSGGYVFVWWKDDEVTEVT